jgi:cysteine-rich repeat protein
MKDRRRMVITAGALLALVLVALTGPAAAQVSKEDRNCISTFNKGIRQVAKTHGKIVRKCLSSFASGTLTAATPEACIAADAGGKLQNAVDKAVEKINRKCAAGFPAFGTSSVSPALGRAILAQFDLMHGSIGPDLDLDLIADADDASCQAKVGAALIKCEDTRLKEFLKCKKKGLKSGQIVDAASLAATCLGTLNNPQPDDSNRIALQCVTKIADTAAAHCSDTDIQQAFDGCNAADPSSLGSCLSSESACQVCRLLNDVDSMARDCDAMDDGADNGSCGAECTDGLVHPEEACDDGNGTDNDGCSSQCLVEGGWKCSGEPSTCSLACGDGILDAGELCDDGDNANGDGCSAICEVESGWSCIGAPSVCTHDCGNGTLQPGNGEVCDDGDETSGDGCSSTCQVEPGYNCTGSSPSTCTFVCGNGVFNSGETCDDNNAVSGDGCSNVCQIETGWLCAGLPSLCGTVCGDGLKRGAEACDDGDATSGDGCSNTCQVELGYACAGAPSICTAVCGDGVIRGAEDCDDSNTTNGDGCSSPLCKQEVTHSCAGQPSVCNALCGNGILNGLEECDDGNGTPGDGCSPNCKIQAGYACAGQPSLCVNTCGNGAIDAGELCDDGNSVSSDGCSSTCKVEAGWFCNTPGQACVTFDVFIDSPANGVFSTAASMVVSGHYTNLPAGQVSVKVNGVNASSVNTTLRTFSHTVSLSQALIFNPVLVTVTNTATGDEVRDRIVIIAGQSVADGAFSPQSVALRLNDSGLDTMEPLIAQLASGQVDVGALLPPGTVITDQCFVNFIGCIGSARVTIANPPPSYGSFNLLMDSQINSVFGDIGIFNLRIDVNIDGSGVVPDCGLRLTANALHLTGNYALEPFPPPNASNVDVNLITNPIGVSFDGFNDEFTSGLCDAPIIGDIIQALLPDIEALAVDGIRGFLSDPDGGGAQDSPIADAIEVVLEGISIAGPIGEGLGLTLETPLFTVAENNSGITLGSDSKFTASIGGGPNQCLPPAGTPDLTRSYSKTETFPSFGANTPVGNVPYGLGICISSAGFNQLLKGQTECGLMRTSLSSIDLDGGGPIPPLPITSTLLSALVPEFSQLPSGTPLRIDVAPTLAPIVTGNNGPAGELTELKIAQMTLDIIETGPEIVWLRGALDARLGLDLAFDGQGLGITIGTPNPSDLTVAIIHNPIGADEAQVETVLPSIITPLIPQLAGALSGFPLPEFFGLQLSGVEVSRNGQFLSLFANLTPTP